MLGMHTQHQNYTKPFFFLPKEGIFYVGSHKRHSLLMWGENFDIAKNFPPLQRGLFYALYNNFSLVVMNFMALSSHVSPSSRGSDCPCDFALASPTAINFGHSPGKFHFD